jgi:hypothetical protein
MHHYKGGLLYRHWDASNMCECVCMYQFCAGVGIHSICLYESGIAFGI